MIRYLSGNVLYKNAEKRTIIIDVQGIGYRVFMPQQELYEIKEEHIAIHTHYSVKEDDIKLYGFSSYDRLELFELLITVSKIGPKNGLNILDTFSSESLIKAIRTENSKYLTKAPGIGLKTAQRMVLELKDKISNINIECEIANDSIVNNSYNEALEGLIALGFSEREVFDVLDNMDIDSLNSEAIVKKALKRLYKS
jgi:Holliday junction DNA helicase RuvA